MTKRKIFPMVCLYLLTFGLYPLFWFLDFQHELKERTKQGPSTGRHFLLSIITLGIYDIIWQYHAGKRLAIQGCKDRSALYLILGIFVIGFLINPFLMQAQANELPDPQITAFVPLPFYHWFFVAIGDFFKKIGAFLWDITKTVLFAFLNIFIGAYKGTIWLGKAIAKFLKTSYIRFRDGGWKTRLSFIFMGFGALANGQIVKGILYLLFQAGVIYFVATDGWFLVAQLRTLGTRDFFEGGWSDACQCYTDAIPASNSMIILLYGIAVLMLIVGLLIFWNMSVKCAYENSQLIAKGKKPASFKQDVHALFDEKFHITVLSLPVVMAFAFTILPLVFMILIAFTNYSYATAYPGHRFTWVFLQNFVNLFSGNDPMYQKLPSSMWRILKWTLTWAVFATVLNYIGGMILALMINKKGIKLKKLWRTIFVITIAIPQFITLLVVSRMLSDTGPVWNMLYSWGWINDSFSFLNGDQTVARTTVIIVNLWVGIPYTMLITSGILMNIPADLYESAKIDGAGPGVQFFKITLPYMLFVTGPYLVTQFIGNINNFNVIFFLTGGGPSDLTLFNAGKTDLLVTWLYKLTVTQANPEYAIGSTLGILIFIVCSFISLIMYSKTGSVQKEDEFQ